MEYIKMNFIIDEPGVGDMLVATLAEAGFEGFEESDKELLAYITAANFDKVETDRIAAQFSAAYTQELVPEQNWNELWESNFQPVIVADFCTIRAHFHDLHVTTPYEIVITPKMSFGTGHHATTQLVMLMMRDVDFNNRSVIDFGTGTGVLAILAEQLGAGRVVAIDNDPWCVENANENLERNNCRRIEVLMGSVEDLSSEPADVILANINRHILLGSMSELSRRLQDGGMVIMSGILPEDQDIIVAAAGAQKLRLVKSSEQENWIALLFQKT